MQKFNQAKISPPMLGAAILLALIVPITVKAQMGIPDRQRGQQLAESLCSNCHAVSDRTAPSHSLPGRSFKSIARIKGQSDIALAGAIVMPHHAMPSVALTRIDIRDLVAYIISMKPEN